MRFGKFLVAGIPECGLGEAGKEVLEPVLLKREQAYSGPAGKLKAASAVFLLAGNHLRPCRENVPPCRQDSSGKKENLADRPSGK